MEFRKLKADEIECRVATVTKTGCSVLLYKDARVDQKLLDETVGALNWKRSHQLIGDRLYCTVEVWDAEKAQWISKQDVGTESYTEKEKGQASDSFKRACFNFGIGRELYTAPFIWIGVEKTNIEEKNGKYTTRDRFKVDDIGYDTDGNICKLTISNSRTHSVVYSLGDADTEEEKMIQSGKNKVSVVQAKSVRISLQKVGRSEEGMCQYFGIDQIEDMTIEQLSQFNKLMEDFKKEQK